MESYKALLFLHVLAAVLGIGVTFVVPFLIPFAQRKGVAATRFALEFHARLYKFAVYPGSGLLVLFGIALIFDDATGYKNDFPAWLMAAITVFAAVVAVSFFVQGPAVRRALGTLDGVPDSPTLPAGYLAAMKRFSMIDGMQGLGIIVIVFLMAWKPGE